MRKISLILFIFLPIILLGAKTPINLSYLELKKSGEVEVIELLNINFSGKEKSILKRCFLSGIQKNGYLYSSKIVNFNIEMDNHKNIHNKKIISNKKGTIFTCLELGVKKYSEIAYFNGTSREYKELDGIYRFDSTKEPLIDKHPFTLSYTIINTLFNEDKKTDAIYLGHIVNGWNILTDNILIYLTLPPNFNAQNSKITFIKDEQFINTDKIIYNWQDTNRIQIKVLDIEYKDFGIKLSFDRGMINSTAINIDKEYTPWRKKYNNIWWSIGALYLIAMFIIWYFFRKKEPRKIISSISKPPEDITILQMGYLLDDMQKAYSAEVISLIDRGYLEPTKNNNIRYQRTKKDIKRLDAYEQNFLIDKVYEEIEISKNRVDFTLGIPTPRYSSFNDNLWKQLSQWAYSQGYTVVNREKLRAKVNLLFVLSLQIFYLYMGYFILFKEFAIDIKVLLFAPIFIFLMLSLFFITPLLALALKIKKRLFTISVHKIFLSFGTIIILEYLFADFLSADNMLRGNSPFLVIATLSLIGLGLIKSIGELTHKGKSLKVKLLSYKAYLEKNNKDLKYRVLFGISDLYLGDYGTERVN